MLSVLSQYEENLDVVSCTFKCTFFILKKIIVPLPWFGGVLQTSGKNTFYTYIN